MMLKRGFPSAAVLLAAWLLACAPRPGVELVDSVQRPPNTGKLDIYESREAVGRPYQTIARLDVTDQKNPGNKKARYLESLVEQARKIGAEGLIILEYRQSVRRVSDGMGGSVEAIVDQASAEAIVYK